MEAKFRKKYATFGKVFILYM